MVTEGKLQYSHQIISFSWAQNETTSLRPQASSGVFVLVPHQGRQVERICHWQAKSLKENSIFSMCVLFYLPFWSASFQQSKAAQTPAALTYTSELWHPHQHHSMDGAFQVYLWLQHCSVIISFHSLARFDESHRYVSNAKQEYVRYYSSPSPSPTPGLFYLGLLKAVKKVMVWRFLAWLFIFLHWEWQASRFYINGKKYI